MSKKKLKILFTASELTPYAKTGGLADVIASLPKALSHHGIDVKIVIPKYRCVTQRLKLVKKKPITFYKTKTKDNIEIFFIDNKQYFDRAHFYGTKKGDYVDNAARFSFFCKSVLTLIDQINWTPDIIHCHDWHTALIPVYLKTHFKDLPIKTLYTIHNVAYQGLFPKDDLATMDISESEFTSEKLEYYGKINLMKAGIVYSDKINTVSETYATEIRTSGFGCGLEGVLKNRKKDLCGILNGIDYDVWDPGYATLLEKQKHKQKLMKLAGFRNVNKNISIIGMVSRLCVQKGFDILEQAMQDLVHMDMKIVLLGTGDHHYHVLFKDLMKKYPDHIKVFLRYDAFKAEEIYAGSDMFLMPSHYEPCGLGQLISLRHGTIPIVNNTGGLTDTINKNNGFVMQEYSAQALVSAVKQAVDAYKDKKSWSKMVKAVMKQDFSWDVSAKKYVDLYGGLV